MQTHDPHEIPELDPKEQVPGGNQDWEGSVAPESRAALMGEAGLVPSCPWARFPSHCGLPGNPGRHYPLGPAPRVRALCTHLTVPKDAQVLL